MPPLTTAFIQDNEAMVAEVTVRERMSDLVVVTDVTIEDVGSDGTALAKAAMLVERELMRRMGLPLQFGSSSKEFHKDKKMATETKMHHLPAPHPKYWGQRYKLFSKFDSGVQMDDEGWYSVTPEAIANHHASRCACALACDLFAGAGGDIIALAKTCGRVLAIDNNHDRVGMAVHNAKVYGVSERIDFICGDSVALLHSIKPDVLYMSPPWGGMEYNKSGKEYSLGDINVAGINGFELLQRCIALTPHVALFLPRNTSVEELAAFAEEAGIPCEIEHNWVPSEKGSIRLKAITVYFGRLAQPALGR